MTTAAGTRVLIVDGDRTRADRIAVALRAAGYPVLSVHDSLDGLIAVEDEKPELVVLDWAMPFIDGATFLYALRAGLTSPPPVLALLGMEDDPGPALRAGAGTAFRFPADIPRLVRTVRELIG